MAYDFGPGTVRSGAYECVGGRMEDNINQNYQVSLFLNHVVAASRLAHTIVADQDPPWKYCQRLVRRCTAIQPHRKVSQ